LGRRAKPFCGDEKVKTLPSASNAALRARCAGAWQLIQALSAEGRISPVANQAALDGRAIHTARQLGSDDLAEELLKTKKLLDEMEARLVADWDPAAILLAREKRLWYRRGITPIHTGRFDYAYRSSDWTKLLIADDKTGRIEVSAAEINDQMRELAALAWCDAPDNVTEITVAICQPWVTRKPSVSVFNQDDLALATLLLNKNLNDINDANAVRTPGPHCAYCPAVAFCEENRLMTNAVLDLAGRIKKGDYQLPVGKYGTVFLDRAFMAQKVLEMIIARYKELLMTDPDAVPGYYIKAGYTRHVISDAHKALTQLDMPLEDFLKCGKFSISELTATIADRSGLSKEAARDRLFDLCRDVISEIQNEPSLSPVSPRRGRPKEVKQSELI
jgi:hypothetical protein